MYRDIVRGSALLILQEFSQLKSAPNQKEFSSVELSESTSSQQLIRYFITENLAGLREQGLERQSFSLDDLWLRESF